MFAPQPNHGGAEVGVDSPLPPHDPYVLVCSDSERADGINKQATSRSILLVITVNNVIIIQHYIGHFQMLLTVTAVLGYR